MKKLFYLAMVVISSVMTACSSDSYMDDMIEEQEKAQTMNANDSTVSRSYEQENNAKIRIKMYEAVNGYSVQISNVRIQNVAGDMTTPSFGSNFEGVTLSDNVYDPTYDRADRSYTSFKANTEVQLVMTFDATLVCEDGSADTLAVRGVTTTLNDTFTLRPGIVYENTVKVDASLLGLNPITFGATVQGYSNNTTEN